MPADRSHSANRQGRQKSCSECVNSKRKCGLQQPKCARCSRQHLTCSYPPQPRSEAAVQPLNTAPECNTTSNVAHIPMNTPDLETTDLDFNFDIPPMPTTFTAETLDFEFPAAASCFDTFPHIVHNPPDNEGQTELQIAPKQAEERSPCATLSHFAKSRALYFGNQIKLAPTTMVEQICTPWMHRMLYDSIMPRSLQDAHAACALYVTRNEINAGHVIHYICTRAQELMNTDVPETQLEIIAHAHALMLYQIMLMFGGDLRFYTQIEALLSHLEDMGGRLIQIAAEHHEPSGYLAVYPGVAARSAWNSYILCESARRTALAAIQVSVMYSVLSGQMRSCNRKPVLETRITLSAHLWGATSAFDFAVAWNEKNHFVITELEFTDVLENAQPDDLDVFANMLLTGMHGIDDIRAWYYTRGGTLEIPQF